MDDAARMKTIMRPGVVQEMRGWPCILRSHCADAVWRKQASSPRPSPRRTSASNEEEREQRLSCYDVVGGEEVERWQTFFTGDVLAHLDSLRGERGALREVSELGRHQR